MKFSLAKSLPMITSSHLDVSLMFISSMSDSLHATNMILVLQQHVFYVTSLLATTRFGTSHAKHLLQVMISNVEKVSFPQLTTTLIVFQFVQRARRQERLDAKSKSLQLPPLNKYDNQLLHNQSSSNHHLSTMRLSFSILLLVLKSTQLRLHLQTQQATLTQCLVQMHENGKEQWTEKLTLSNATIHGNCVSYPLVEKQSVQSGSTRRRLKRMELKLTKQESSQKDMRKLLNWTTMTPMHQLFTLRRYMYFSL